MSSNSTQIEAQVKVTYARDNDFDGHWFVNAVGNSEEDIIQKVGQLAKEHADGEGITYDHLRIEIVQKIHILSI